MKFEIDSSNITFSGKGFKSFFERINESCKSCNVTYFVVGAFARDIVLENIFKQPTGIATMDIDVAIRVDSWENFTLFIEHLKFQHGFKNGKNAHEFISPEGIQTDIIPYGTIETNRTISFPPNFDKEINMLGFAEIRNSTLSVSLDKEVDIKVASIEGLTILKLTAWKDREPDRVSEKHTRDIGFLITAYFDALVSEFATDFSDLFDEEEFDSIVCGARALGRRMKQIVGSSKELTKQLHELASYILREEDNSLFVTQLTNATSWEYSFALRVVKSLFQGFTEMQ